MATFQIENRGMWLNSFNLNGKKLPNICAENSVSHFAAILGFTPEFDVDYALTSEQEKLILAYADFRRSMHGLSYREDKNKGDFYHEKSYENYVFRMYTKDSSTDFQGFQILA